MNDALGPSWLHSRGLRAERETERIFEMSPALLAVAGFDGYLRRFNPAFEVFGYSREELLSRPWIEFAHPNDRERMLQAAASLERGADVVELTNQGRLSRRLAALGGVEHARRAGGRALLCRGPRRDREPPRRGGAGRVAVCGHAGGA
jgi:PAS domain-containing protein